MKTYGQGNKICSRGPWKEPCTWDPLKFEFNLLHVSSASGYQLQEFVIMMGNEIKTHVWMREVSLFHFPSWPQILVELFWRMPGLAWQWSSYRHPVGAVGYVNYHVKLDFGYWPSSTHCNFFKHYSLIFWLKFTIFGFSRVRYKKSFQLIVGLDSQHISA